MLLTDGELREQQNTNYNRHLVVQIMITQRKVKAIKEEPPLFSLALGYVHWTWKTAAVKTSNNQQHRFSVHSSLSFAKIIHNIGGQ